MEKYITALQTSRFVCLLGKAFLGLAYYLYSHTLITLFSLSLFQIFALPSQALHWIARSAD